MTMSVTHVPTMDAAVRMKPSGRVVTNVLVSEWTKLRSVRSTYWTLFAAAAFTIGLGALLCAIFAAQYAGMSAEDKAGFYPASFSLTGGILAQMAIAVLGVLVINSEYASGMIRTTFSSVPQRLTVQMAKATQFAGVTLVVTSST
jgi:ABC-2 type transport system permease protein